MGKATVKALKARNALRVRKAKEPGCEVLKVRLSGDIEVATRDGWLCFWTAGREVRVGPLTKDQAEKLCEDLGYDAVD
jgi:hypothetical protein